MQAYIVRRLLALIPTLFFASVIVFVTVRLIPGDIIDLMLSQNDIAAAKMGREQLEKALGLDQPMWLQYGRWVGSILFEGNKALVRPSVSGSYPSGHTTYVTVAAIMVATMVPEKRDAIWQRAWDYAQSRVIGGMHYPNDLLGGRLAGVPGIALISCRTAGLQARSYS